MKMQLRMFKWIVSLLAGKPVLSWNQLGHILYKEQYENDYLMTKEFLSVIFICWSLKMYFQHFQTSTDECSKFWFSKMF